MLTLDDLDKENKLAPSPRRRPCTTYSRHPLPRHLHQRHCLSGPGLRSPHPAPGSPALRTPLQPGAVANGHGGRRLRQADPAHRAQDRRHRPDLYATIRPTAATRPSPSSSCAARPRCPRPDALLAILRDILLSVKLDNRERFTPTGPGEQGPDSRRPDGPDAATRVVIDRLRGPPSTRPTGLSEQMEGVSHLFFLRHLIAEVQADWPAVLEKLETIRPTLLNRKAMLCHVTTDAEGWAKSAAALGAFLADLPITPVERQTWDPVLPHRVTEGLTIPAQVNYVGKGVEPLRTRLPAPRLGGCHRQSPAHELALGADPGPGRGVRRLLRLRPPRRGLHLPLLPRPQPDQQPGCLRQGQRLLARD